MLIIVCVKDFHSVSAGMVRVCLCVRVCVGWVG